MFFSSLFLLVPVEVPIPLSVYRFLLTSFRSSSIIVFYHFYFKTSSLFQFTPIISKARFRNLLFTMKLVVEVQIAHSKVLKISCGDGQQSIKWLASVVQSRIKDNQLFRNNFEEENFLVTEIRNAEGELLNPDDRIFEHVVDNKLGVSATVVSNYPVDEWENPEVGDFIKVANIKSDIGSNWVNEIEAWRNSLQKIKTTNTLGLYNNNVLSPRMRQVESTSTLIKIGHGFSEEDIISAFELDWSSMSWGWLNPTEYQRNVLGDTLKRNYSIFCNIFAHYCGQGQVGQRYGLTIRDFGHLMNAMLIYDFKISQDIIGMIFGDYLFLKFDISSY